MMIPNFLRSIAALVRELIAQGIAVHVTEQTAQELELLAGLPWDQRLTAADVALGWLLVAKLDVRSLAMASASIDQLSTAVVRAAVCAELATMANLMQSGDLNWTAGCRPGPDRCLPPRA